jgi:L-threonylcarbamoyladenylate synthase
MTVNIREEGPRAIKEAAEVLGRGGLVITPSQTNYNLICDPTNDDAIARLFDAKRRTKFGPLTLAISRPEDIVDYVEIPPHFDVKQLTSLWPSMLTIILPKRYPYPERLTMGASTLGVMNQGDCAVQRIVDEFGPVGLTSANLSGQGDVFVDFDKAAEELGDKVDLLIRGSGPSVAALSDNQHRSNTIVDLTFTPPYLVRYGMFPVEPLREAFPDLIEDPDAYKEAIKARLAKTGNTG